MPTAFETFVNDELPNRVATQETSQSAGYYARYTGTAKLTTERSPAQVLSDIGAADSATVAAHISDSTIHFTQGSIAIAASQITSGTFDDARIAESNVTQHQAAINIATSQVTSGTFADARIAQSNVTQHQAALEIEGTQVKSAGPVTSGWVLTADGAGNADWVAAASGSGDVVGPAGATDNAFARYDTATGKLLQDSLVLCTDAGVVSGITQLDVDSVRLDGTTVSSTGASLDMEAGTGGAGYTRVKHTDANGRCEYWATKGHEFFDGVGTGSTTVTINGTLIADNITGNLLFSQAVASTTATEAPEFITERSGDAVDSGNDVDTGYVIGRLEHRGLQSTYRTGFQIESIPTQDWTATEGGTETIFSIIPYNTIALTEVFRLTSGTTSINGMQMASNTKIYLGGGTTQQIYGISGDNYYEVGASDAHIFTVALGEEVRVEANEMTFNNGATDTSISWSSSGKMGFKVGSTEEMYLVANALTFNAGGTDMQLAFDTADELWMQYDGQSIFGVGDAEAYFSDGSGTTEITFAANQMTFNNGASDTALEWGTNGRLGFKVGSTVEMYLMANNLYFENGFSDWVIDFATVGTLKFKWGTFEEMRLTTSLIYLYENTDITGYCDASGGFRDNGNIGVDGSFLDRNSNTVTVSGGIITSLS